MTDDQFHVLEALTEDNDDGYGCFETIEPYVNANRAIELKEAEILKVLSQMESQRLIDVVTYEKDEDKFRQATKGSLGMDSWFRATVSGAKAYRNAK